MTRRHLVPLMGVLTLALSACSDASTATPATTHPTTAGEPRVVDVTMDDIRFEPTTLHVERGETIKFRFTNNGAIPHDAFLGDAAAQAEHEEEMAAMTDSTMEGMDHGGHSDLAVTVSPGDVQTLTYTFADDAAIEIGCHQPGHYAAGMRLAIEIG